MAGQGQRCSSLERGMDPCLAGYLQTLERGMDPCLAGYIQMFQDRDHSWTQSLRGHYEALLRRRAGRNLRMAADAASSCHKPLK